MSVVLTDLGRSWIASVVKDQQFFLAISEGLAEWDTDKETTFTFNVGGTYNIPYTLLQGFSLVLASNPATVYTLGDDYTVNLTTGVVTRTVGGAIEADASVKAAYHVRPPNATRQSTELQEVIGWKKVTDLRYVIPDAEGDIVTAQDTYSVSLDPTPYLMITVTIMENEVSDSQVKEVGLYTGTVPVVGQPDGRTFFTPIQIETAGSLFAHRIYPTINRSPTAREYLQYILPF